MVEHELKWLHVRDYVDAAQKSEEYFTARHSNPFLVLLGQQASDKEVGEDHFTTRHSEYDPISAIRFAGTPSLNPLWIVLPVVKRPGVNTYTEMITIGRANNCDIVIPSQKVSRFHCYIRSVPWDKDKYIVSDGGSRNGTRLNEALIPKRQPVAIKSGDRLALGSKTTMCFYLARDFKAILKQKT